MNFLTIYRRSCLLKLFSMSLLFASCSGPQRRPSSDSIEAIQTIAPLVQSELLRQYRGSKENEVRAEAKNFAADGIASRSIPVTRMELNEQANFPAEARQILRIDDLASLPLLSGEPVIDFPVETEKYAAVIPLQNHLAANSPSQSTHPEAFVLDVHLRCDHPVTVQRRIFFDLKNMKEAKFNLPVHNSTMQKISLNVPSGANRCTLLFKKQGQREFNAGIRIVSKSFFSEQKLAGSVREACLYDPSNQPGSPGWTPYQYYLQAHYPSMTCDLDADSAELLDDPIESLNTKVHALIGSRLSAEMIAKRDMNGPIDFSKAPKFDSIVLSTMEFKVDFYGTILSRILQWHAERGTIVRVIVPGVSTSLFSKDMALIRKMERHSPNIKIQLYRDDSRKSRWSINRLQRVIHAKILAGVSTANPKESFLVIGGRNVKDTFLFHSPPDYSAHPEMEQYGTLLSPFSFFSDLEVLIRGDHVAREVTAQYLSFWNRDHQTMRMRPTTAHIPSALPRLDRLESEGTRVRHLISVPFADGGQLEDLVADLIRSATKSLKMVSPYFRPTKKIAAAFHDAVNRGVSIQFITELDLIKDNSPPITMGVNTQSVNRFSKYFSVYVSKDSHMILHSKAILVDGELLFISGTNLNMRSFLHDIENGLLIMDKSVASQFENVFENVYLPGSRLVSEELKVKFLDKVIIPLVDQYF
ncbi:MAG TPA: phosphatidylserine/phosphatidylglycerophosphate/cardiolipin synthase family protein [Bdellovibrionota bacterium]|nr:phosphatidylserine/phosphatidylglycerophosphate/cardiolipin synthase family protein [Bdellovibrionota bacterium]